MNEQSFSTLLYRYFFFDWLLRDVRGGTEMEKGLAIHHNRRAARFLPTYMYRWMWLSLAAYTLAGLFDVFLDWPEVASCFYVAGSLGVVVNALLGAVWLGLTQLGQKTTQ